MIDYLLAYAAVMGCGIGIAFFLTLDRPAQIKFIWFDLWVGAYYDRAKRRLYILPLPCLVFLFDFDASYGDNGA